MSDRTDLSASDATQLAATLVVFRRAPGGGAPQILLVERMAALRFAGGATVFPGGKLDPADHALAAALAGDDPVELASRIAAVRETLEETGLALGLRPATGAPAMTAAQAAAARAMLAEGAPLAAVLGRMGWQLALDALQPWARWWPREGVSRVFDTRFYLADLGTGAVAVEADRTENRRLFWASAAEALDMADTGGIRVIFPTRRNLERLARFETVADCMAHARATPVVTISPRLVERDGDTWLTIPAGAGYPVVEERLSRATRG